jgi:hypothetical protein
MAAAPYPCCSAAAGRLRELDRLQQQLAALRAAATTPEGEAAGSPGSWQQHQGGGPRSPLQERGPGAVTSPEGSPSSSGGGWVSPGVGQRRGPGTGWAGEGLCGQQHAWNI